MKAPIFSDIETTWITPSMLSVLAFCRQLAVDVDYVDISDTVITDPAHLLPLESVHPFWVEYRRREAQYNAVAEFGIALETMLRDFYRNKLILARGVNHCPYRWESEYTTKLLESFCEFEETVLNALHKFLGPAYKYSDCLCKFLGFNDEEFAEMEEEQKEDDRRKSLHFDFQQVVYCLLHESDAPDDDLPF